MPTCVSLFRGINVGGHHKEAENRWNRKKLEYHSSIAETEPAVDSFIQPVGVRVHPF